MFILDTDLTLRTILALQKINVLRVEDVLILGRSEFLKSRLTCSVKLEVLNFLHKNKLFFIKDE